jgi:hypothetical protein
MAYDIFNPLKTVISSGLEGKIILLYGGNGVGKTAQATRFKNPFVIATEMGLNEINDVPYAPINKWKDFKDIVKQFTNPINIKKAKELYSTIIIDEVYAASIFCQDYICQTIGDGALTLSDAPDTKHNLYSAYEKEMFRQINALTNSGFTVVFIAHEQADNKTGYISPKGDKRSIVPIIDKADYVVYIKGNGVDDNNRVIKSSAYLAATNAFFARSRNEYVPTYIKEFTAENLEAAIQEGIDKKAKLNGAKIVSFEEQKKQNQTEELDFKALVQEFNDLVKSLIDSSDNEDEFAKNWAPVITQITEKTLGKGSTVNTCNENQVEAVAIIVDDLKEKIKSVNA